LPSGAGAGQLQVCDVPGRRVGGQRVLTPRAEATLPTIGWPPGVYQVSWEPDRPDQPRATTRLLLQ
ncbi:hypothetical protein, partial [Hymenobacter agri]